MRCSDVSSLRSSGLWAGSFRGRSTAHTGVPIRDSTSALTPLFVCDRLEGSTRDRPDSTSCNRRFRETPAPRSRGVRIACGVHGCWRSRLSRGRRYVRLALRNTATALCSSRISSVDQVAAAKLPLQDRTTSCRSRARRLSRIHQTVLAPALAEEATSAVRAVARSRWRIARRRRALPAVEPRPG